MIMFREEKIKNAIIFFLRESKNNELYQTSLYKYLAFLDFNAIEKWGRPVLNLEYRAMEHGPVPIELYNQLEEKTKNYCSIIDDQDQKKVKLKYKNQPNMDYFSGREINLMNELIEIYSNDYDKAHIMSEASHEKIKAWKKTWEKDPNGIIDKSLSFENESDLKKSYLLFEDINRINAV